MGSKEDYLDSLLDSVMQDSDRNEKTEADEDVTALLDTMSDDGELAEINDLLKQSEQGSSTSLADDMLALLEQADAKDKENESEEEKKASDAAQENSPFDFFADENSEDEGNVGEIDTAPEQPLADNAYPVEETSSANERDSADGTAPDESDRDNDAGWEELLEPAESKAEQKVRKKQKKQEEQARRREEKAKAREEKNKSKEEKARAKKEKAGQKQSEEHSDIENIDAEAETAETEKPKKSGFFARLFGGLLEEVPEQEELQEIDLSDENKAILEEVGKEEIAPKRAKKKGKKDKKKGKKSADGQSSEESEESGQSDKKGKKEAKKKEKKAKKAQEAGSLQEPIKKLPRKKVISIFVICLTFAAIIVISSLIIPSYLAKKEARKAYYNGDYEEVYHLFSGEKLSGSDEILYERSVMVLYLDNKLDAYHLHVIMGEEKEALNELLTAVAFYQKNLERAAECGAIEEMQPGYEEILKLLQDSYQVSEERAVEIAQMESLAYNKALYQILYGTEFTIPEMQPEIESSDIQEPDQIQAEGMQEAVPADVLPEEEELLRQDSSVMIDQAHQAMPQDAGTSSQDVQTMSQEAQTGEEETGDENLLYSGTVQNGQAVVQ